MPRKQIPTGRILNPVTRRYVKRNGRVGKLVLSGKIFNIKKKIKKVKKIKIKKIPLKYPDAEIDVYTDGSCLGNGRANARAGFGVFFSHGDPRNVSKKIRGKIQTNNHAELRALKEVYKILKKEIKNGRKINLYSDSEYALNAAGEYGRKQEKANWKNGIPNLELVKEVYYAYKGTSVVFWHVKAHTGEQDKHSLGNHEADLLAVDGAKS